MNKKIYLLLVGVILGLGVTFMVAYILQNTLFAKKNPPTSANPSAVTQTVNSTFSRVDKLDYDGKYSEAASELETYIKSNPSEEEKQKASLKLAAAYFNAKDYDNAIIWYEKVEQQSVAYKIAAYHGLAYTYRAKGDKQKAVTYLQQAIDFMKTNKDFNDELNIASDEQAIRILESK